jgi:hypothetical protein
VLVNVLDDVQVRNVELIVNGQVVQNDVSFPFDLSAVALGLDGTDSVTIQVRATDTGGNVSLSNILTVALVPDTFAPTVLSVDPAAGTSTYAGRQAVRVRFSEAINPSGVTGDDFFLIEAGPGGVFGDGNDVRVDAQLQLRDEGRLVQLTTVDPLGVGSYQLHIRADAIADVAGNLLGAGELVSGFIVLPARAPTVEFTFDDGTGTTVTDASGGAAAHFVGITQPTWVTPGRVGAAALAFSGDGLYLQNGESGVNTAAPLTSLLGGTASLVAWIKTTQVGSATFWQSPGITGVEQTGSGNDIFWGYLDQSGRIGLKAGDGPGALSTVAINDGLWHQVAFTRDMLTGEQRVYVDGVLQAVVFGDRGQKSSLFSTIGAVTVVALDTVTRTGANYFNGVLDDVRLYSSVLTPDEVASLYAV